MQIRETTPGPSVRRRAVRGKNVGKFRGKITQAKLALLIGLAGRVLFLKGFQTVFYEPPTCVSFAPAVGASRSML